jgi:hypothetical protein
MLLSTLFQKQSARGANMSNQARKPNSPTNGAGTIHSPNSLSIPSPTFEQLGFWPREKGKGVITAGTEEYFKDRIGLVGFGPSNSGRIYVTMTRSEVDCLLPLAEKGFSLGLCGSRRLNGNTREEAWMHIQDSDLVAFAEALRLIQRALN